MPKDKTDDEPKTVTLPGVEIFETGTHNGDAYSVDDLKAMVAAAPEVGFEPPVKIGHMSDKETTALLEKEGMPALGWIRNLRVKGKKLLADFVDVPRRVADVIRKGAYKRVSAEIYWDFKKGKEVFPRVLKAVALLGAEIPALTGLKAVEALYDDAGNEFRIYDWEMTSPFPPPMPASSMLKEKEAVNYRLSDYTGENPEEDHCGVCRFYLGDPEGIGSCYLVSGEIAGEALCDLYEAREAYQFAHKRKVKPYVIEKRGDEWCLIAQSTGKTLGCHPTEQGAKDQEAAIKANMSHRNGKTVRLSLEKIKEVCPSCAERMEFLNLRELKFEWDPVAKTFQGFNQGLCDKFAPAEGFRTRCMDSSFADVADDPGALCNALKEFCYGTVADSDTTPARVAGERHPAAQTNARVVAERETIMAEDKELLALKEKEVADLTAKVATLEAKEAETKKHMERTTTLESDLAKANAELHKIQHERRLDTIRTFVAERKRQGKILPKWEPKLIALLDSADETQVRTFTEKEGAATVEKKMTQRQLVEALLDDMPQLVSFTELTPHVHEGDDQVPDADAAAEVRKKIAAYRLEHPDVPYDTAFTLVLDANPDLKNRYAGTKSRS